MIKTFAKPDIYPYIYNKLTHNMVEGLCRATHDISKLGSTWYKTGTARVANDHMIFKSGEKYRYTYSTELNKYILKKEFDGNFTMLPEFFESLFTDLSKQRDSLIESIINE